MKKIITALIILIALVSIILAEMHYADKAYGSMSAHVTELHSQLFVRLDGSDNGDKSDSDDKAVSAQSNKQLLAQAEVAVQAWDNYKRWLMIFTHHHIIVDMDIRLGRLKSLIAVNNIADGFVECNSVLHMLRELQDHNKLSLQNML